MKWLRPNESLHAALDGMGHAIAVLVTATYEGTDDDRKIALGELLDAWDDVRVVTGRVP